MGHAERHAGVAGRDLAGRTVLVTGATDGIGRETALALGRLGARVLVHGRDRRKADRVLEELEAAGAAGGEAYLADFADLDAVRDLAADVRADADGLDALVNNAGGWFTDGRLTDAGVEYTFAVNHLAPFVLTGELLSTLRAAGGDRPARVITVSSEAHRQGSIELDAVRDVADYSGWAAYCRSKLANVLFTRDLSRRLRAAGAPVTANALHPGVVPGSGFARNAPGPIRALVQGVGRLDRLLPFVDSPAEAAATSVYLVAARAVADVSGGYFVDCDRRTPAPAARDDAVARRLWEFSAEAAGADPLPVGASDGDGDGDAATDPNPDLDPDPDPDPDRDPDPGREPPSA